MIFSFRKMRENAYTALYNELTGRSEVLSPESVCEAIGFAAQRAPGLRRAHVYSLVMRDLTLDSIEVVRANWGDCFPGDLEHGVSPRQKLSRRQARGMMYVALAEAFHGHNCPDDEVCALYRRAAICTGREQADDIGMELSHAVDSARQKGFCSEELLATFAKRLDLADIKTFDNVLDYAMSAGRKTYDEAVDAMVSYANKGLESSPESRIENLIRFYHASVRRDMSQTATRLRGAIEGQINALKDDRHSSQLREFLDNGSQDSSFFFR